MRSHTTEKAWSQARKRNQLANENRRLVHLVVRRMSATCREPYEDLYQIGYLGLLKAAEKYKPELNNAFSSFAVPWIQGEIQHYLRDQWQTIKIPRSILESRAKVKRVKRSLGKMGRDISEMSVASGLGVAAEVVEVGANLTVSLDELLHEPAEEAQLEEAENKEALKEAVAKLPVKQKQAVVEFYWANRSIGQIAKSHRCSEQEIKARLKLGISKLRKELPLCQI
jgi:RNA polymerase sigma-B factor